MLRITKALNQFADEIDAFDDGEAHELKKIFLKALLLEAENNGAEITESAGPSASVTASKAGPYVEVSASGENHAELAEAIRVGLGKLNPAP